MAKKKEPTDEQRRWVARITGGGFAAAQRMDEKKQQFEARMRERLNPTKREEIAEGLNFTISTDVDGLGSLVDHLRGEGSAHSRSADGDQRKAFDVRSEKFKKLLSGVKDENVMKAMRSFQEVVELSEEMSQLEQDGERVYTDDDIFKLLWEPLRREGVVPETFIPKKYSETARHFAGASELYNQRLESDDSGEGRRSPMELIAGAGGAAMAAIASISQVAVVGVDVAAGSKEATDHASKALAVASKSFEAAKGAAPKIRQGTSDLVEKGDIYAGLSAYNTALGCVLTATSGKDMSAAVTGLIGKCILAVKASESIAKGDIKGLMAAFGKDAGAMVGGLGDEEIYEALSLAITQAFTNAGEAAQKLNDQIAKARDADSANPTIKGIAEDALNLGIKIAIDSLESTLNGVRDPDPASKLALNQALGGVTGGAQQGVRLAAAMVDDKVRGARPDPARLKARMEEAGAKANAQMEAELKDSADEPSTDIGEALTLGFADAQSDAEESAQAELRKLHNIEKMIAKIERNRKIFELAKSITNGTTGTVAAMVPVAGAAASGTALVFQFIEAAKHTQQFCRWASSLEDARSADTVQYYAILNRFDLQRRQMLLADAQTALKAAELVGQILKTLPDEKAQAAGLITVAASRAADAMMTEAVKFFTEVEMMKAWRSYKKALANPDDRNEMRIALAANPTLAKYSLAYGACVEKHPIAIQAVKKCGIDELTLASEKTNENLVVKYLEAMFNEDPKVLGKLPLVDDWHPEQIAVTSVSFTKFYIAAMDEKKGVRLQKNPNAAHAVGKLKLFEESLRHPSYKLPSINTLEDFDAHVEQCRAVVARADDLASQLMFFEPLDDKGRVCIGFESYLNGLIAEVRRKREQASKMASAPPPLDLAPLA